MPENYTTPQHCPGYTDFKNLKVVSCKCTNCGKEMEIFSDRPASEMPLGEHVLLKGEIVLRRQGGRRGVA